MKGLVHIYTGDGKGKTTAAIGLGIRAVGRGKKVLMVQFIKGNKTGEMFLIEKLNPDFLLYRERSIKTFSWKMIPEEKALMAEDIISLFNHAEDEAGKGCWDMIILDEIMASMSLGYIPVDRVLDFALNKPDNIELVMTGRNAPDKLVEIADYVSRIEMVKHPLNKGISARIGVEF